MLQEVTIHIYDEDHCNLEQIKKRYPRWSPETILRRALAMFANSLAQPAPQPANEPRSARQDIEELFGR